jgi:hypothetical protein
MNPAFIAFATESRGEKRGRRESYFCSGAGSPEDPAYFAWAGFGSSLPVFCILLH